MQVSCESCDWNGDSSDAVGTGTSENDHGVSVEEMVCPACGGELN